MLLSVSVISSGIIREKSLQKQTPGSAARSTPPAPRTNSASCQPSAPYVLSLHPGSSSRASYHSPLRMELNVMGPGEVFQPVSLQMQSCVPSAYVIYSSHSSTLEAQFGMNPIKAQRTG